MGAEDAQNLDLPDVTIYPIVDAVAFDGSLANMGRVSDRPAQWC